MSEKFLLTGDTEGKVNIYSYVQDESNPKNYYLIHMRTIVEGTYIQDIQIDNVSSIVVISSNESIALIDLLRTKKIGARLMQKN